MQLEILNKVPENETRKYLRVATITNEKSPLFFLYIGKDENSIKFLLNTTISGAIAENFEGARKLIQSENLNGQSIDVIIIDIAYDPVELKDFQTFLNFSGSGFNSIPLIYNEHHLLLQEKYAYSNIIDDVIDISNWQFDFTSKISFLKKSKEFTKVFHNNDPKIEASSCF